MLHCQGHLFIVKELRRRKRNLKQQCCLQRAVRTYTGSSIFPVVSQLWQEGGKKRRVFVQAHRAQAALDFVTQINAVHWSFFTHQHAKQMTAHHREATGVFKGGVKKIVLCAGSCLQRRTSAGLCCGRSGGRQPDLPGRNIFQPLQDSTTADILSTQNRNLFPDFEPAFFLFSIKHTACSLGQQWLDMCGN